MNRTNEELGAAMYGAPSAVTPNIAPAASLPSAAQIRTQAELADAMYPSLAKPAPAPENNTLMTEPEGAAIPQPSKASGESPAQSPADQTQEEKPEAAPKPNIPQHIKDMRDSDTARQMYSPQNTYAAAIPDNVFEGAEGIDDKVKAATVAELREISQDLGLSTSEVTELRNRAAFVRNTSPTVEDQRAEAVEGLNAAFGHGAASALRDARALLQRDPRTAQLIEGMGLGDDPRTVVLIAQAARRERMNGRLK